MSNAEKKQLADMLEISVKDLSKLTKAQYRKLAVRYHPDKFGGNDELANAISSIISKLYAG